MSANAGNIMSRGNCLFTVVINDTSEIVGSGLGRQGDNRGQLKALGIFGVEWRRALER